MKKSLLAVALLGAFSTAAFAQSNVTIYGVADLGLVKRTNQTVREEGNHTSRLGFKGTEDLGGGLSAIFNLEGGLSLDTGSTNSQSGNTGLFNRAAWVGLSSGNVGWVRLGRQKTAFYDASIRVDPFGNEGIARTGALDTIPAAGTAPAVGGNYGYLLGQANRRDNAITIGTANLGGFVGEAQYVFSEVGTGGKGTNNGYNLAAMYDNGPISAALAYEKVGANSLTPSATFPATFPSGAFNAGDFKMWNANVGYAFGPVKATLGYSRGNSALAAARRPRSAQVGLNYAIGAGNLKATYSNNRADNLRTVNQYGVGYDYHLSKRTDAYAYVNRAKASGSGSINAVQVGLAHNF